jgi:hypothetical protein
MSLSPLLTHPRLTIITGHADHELGRIRDIVDPKVLVDGRTDLELLLGRLLAEAEKTQPTPKTLDLVGHSVAGTSVLQLGDWVIDIARSGVSAFFRELADHDVLPRLGVYAVRLLGCRTAESAQARRTICSLSEILDLEVYGTTGLLFANHYNVHGFDDAWRFLLVGASDLRRTVAQSSPVTLEGTARALDLDSLPASAIEDEPAWPTRLSDAYTTRAILRLIRRNDGAPMPGLLAMPRCELAIPSSTPDAYHRVQLVLDGDFVRVYPDGASKPGVLYPVTDPHLMRILVDKLPLFDPQANYGSEQRIPMLYSSNVIDR